jgi:hypothetical protein
LNPAFYHGGIAECNTTIVSRTTRDNKRSSGINFLTIGIPKIDPCSVALANDTIAKNYYPMEEELYPERLKIS